MARPHAAHRIRRDHSAAHANLVVQIGSGEIQSDQHILAGHLRRANQNQADQPDALLHRIRLKLGVTQAQVSRPDQTFIAVANPHGLAARQIHHACRGRKQAPELCEQAARNDIPFPEPACPRHPNYGCCRNWLQTKRPARLPTPGPAGGTAQPTISPISIRCICRPDPATGESITT